MLDVKTLREAVAGLPDDAPVFPVRADLSEDDGPAVKVFGFRKRKDFDGNEGLAVLVELHYPDDEDEEWEDEDETEKDEEVEDE